MKPVDFEIIQRYINGASDESDRKYVESLFLDGENNPGLRNSIQKDWDLLPENATLSEVNLSHIFDRIQHLIRKNEVEKNRKPLRKIIRIYMKVAAFLLTPLLLAASLIYGSILYKNKINSEVESTACIYAPMGSRVSFTLPDGTIGMLNSGSYLSYDPTFSKGRNVKLEGEAWFEVTHAKDHPFEVIAGNSIIKVLGTSFNLSAYSIEKYVEIVLVDGKVEFIDPVINKKETLLPSERLVLKNGKSNRSIVDPIKYNSWTEGKLVFRGDPMAEVARRIERWYNVNITLADRDIENYSFHATFEDDKLEDVLKYLSMTSPIAYRITPRQSISDGSFKKEEVIIYKKK